MSENEQVTVPGVTYKALCEEYRHASHSKTTWVMDLDSYKQVRRIAGIRDDEDEDKWVPDSKDRLLGLPMVVRDGGGEPHIEWIAPEDGGS